MFVHVGDDSFLEVFKLPITLFPSGIRSHDGDVSRLSIVTDFSRNLGTSIPTVSIELLHFFLQTTIDHHWVQRKNLKVSYTESSHES
jgi:hypothetical protein